MEVMTSQPIHGEPFIPNMKPTKLRTWALCGAALGLLGGFSLATITALNYPLVKGGMPIVAPWTVGLITYETTMLGAVLATLVGLLVETAAAEFQEPARTTRASSTAASCWRCRVRRDSRASVEKRGRRRRAHLR